jgi:hypothetical protein
MRPTTRLPTLLAIACFVGAARLILAAGQPSAPAAAAAAAAAAAPPAPAPATTTTSPARVRIGVYDSRAVAVAFAPSGQNRHALQQLMNDAKRAEAAKDDKRLAELKAQGAARQRRMHLQGFSNAPVDDILAHVRDRLPDVARRAGVVAIVPAADFHDAAAVETVDVTDDLVALFEPSERTLRTVAEVRRREPIAIEVIAKMEDDD